MNVSGVHLPIDGPPRGALSSAKRRVRRALASRLLTPVWSTLIRDRVAFLTLHRFAEPEHGLFGHDLGLVRQALERLRREGYALLSVDDAMRRLLGNEGFPPRSVVFTMDDGYRGAMEQCEELFLAYDCPLTVFLATGFLDGTCWLWWDQLEWICLASERRTLEVDWNGRIVRLDTRERRSTIVTLLEVSEWAKTLPDEEKWRFIHRLAEVADVDVPARPPSQYAPLSWDEVRRLEGRGLFSFGPHTVTHPILPRATDEQAERELTESWERVRTEVRRPVGVFSYPNGSYGPREVRILQRLGLPGAVTTESAYASSQPDGDDAWRYTIPRFSYPELPDPLVQIASGFQTLEMGIRRLRSAR
jgi:peptidoglycan/xylan/chitin deacetylase (PgdA/CDA1 family)